MNRCGIEISYKNVPKLDPQFIPMEQFTRAYLKGAKQPLAIAVERNQAIPAFTNLYSRHPEMREADFIMSNGW